MRIHQAGAAVGRHHAGDHRELAAGLVDVRHDRAAHSSHWRVVSRIGSAVRSWRLQRGQRMLAGQRAQASWKWRRSRGRVAVGGMLRCVGEAGLALGTRRRGVAGRTDGRPAVAVRLLLVGAGRVGHRRRVRHGGWLAHADGRQTCGQAGVVVLAGGRLKRVVLIRCLSGGGGRRRASLGAVRLAVDGSRRVGRRPHRRLGPVGGIEGILRSSRRLQSSCSLLGRGRVDAVGRAARRGPSAVDVAVRVLLHRGRGWRCRAGGFQFEVCWSRTAAKQYEYQQKSRNRSHMQGWRAEGSDCLYKPPSCWIWAGEAKSWNQVLVLAVSR